MTQDEIIEIAMLAGFDLSPTPNMLYTVRGNHAQLKRLINLVAAKEREACAKVARLFYDQKYGVLPLKKSIESNKNLLALEIEEAILARGQA